MFMSDKKLNDSIKKPASGGKKAAAPKPIVIPKTNTKKQPALPGVTPCKSGKPPKTGSPAIPAKKTGKQPALPGVTPMKKCTTDKCGKKKK